jgi:hypothetical protein
VQPGVCWWSLQPWLRIGASMYYFIVFGPHDGALVTLGVGGAG